MKNISRSKIRELSDDVKEAYNNVNWKTARIVFGVTGVAQIIEAYISHGLNNWPLSVFDDSGELFQTITTLALVSGVGLVASYLDSQRKKEFSRIKLLEEKFRTVADFTHDWEYWKLPNGKFEYISPAVEQITGYSVQDFNNDPHLLENIIHPEDRPFFINHLDGVPLESSIPEELLYRIITRSGKEKWISHNCTSIYNSDGVYMGRRASNRDITTRKRSELIQSATYNMLDASVTTNTLEELLEKMHSEIGNLMYAKNFFVALYDEKTNLYTFRYFSDEKDKDSPLTPVQINIGFTDYVRKTGKPLLVDENQSRQMINSGEVQLIGSPSKSWMGVPLFKEQKVIGVAVIQSYVDTQQYTLQDLDVFNHISQTISLTVNRRTAEEKLKFYKHIITNSDMALSVTDLNNTFIFVNAAFEKMYGYSREEILGKPLSILRSKNNNPRLMSQIQSRTYEGGLEFELLNVDKNGREFPIYLRTSVIKNDQGEIIATMGTVVDITERKDLETKLQQSVADLTDALANVKQLSGLLSICGYCKNIRTDEGSYVRIEQYIKEHTDANFSHGICPDCMKQHHPEIYASIEAKKKVSDVTSGTISQK
jgi:PAS domain S-box-containing protein